MNVNRLGSSFLPVIAILLMAVTVPLAAYSIATSLMTKSSPMLYNTLKDRSQIGTTYRNCHTDLEWGVVWSADPSPLLIRL